MNAIYSLYRSFVEKNRLKKRKKEAKKYAGYGVVCEICGSEFRNFAPFGITQRENARCHLCNSLERHRLIYKYFNEKTTLFRPNRKIKVLHFAPENFLYNILSQNPNIEYIPCDINPKLYKYRGKTKIVKVDITDIPFDDNCFDVIICNHVLEHVIDDKLAMSELYRVMKSGGWGMFQIPMSGWGYFPKSIDSKRSVTFEDPSIVKPEEREKTFGQNDHVRLYGADYKQRLESAGFSVIEDDFVQQMPEKDLFKFGFMPAEIIYICRKEKEE